MLFWIKLHDPFSAFSLSVAVSWSTEKDSKQRKRNYCYAKTAVLLKGCLLERHLLAGW